MHIFTMCRLACIFFPRNLSIHVHVSLFSAFYSQAYCLPFLSALLVCYFVSVFLVFYYIDFILGCHHSTRIQKHKTSNTGKKHVKYNKQNSKLSVHTDKRTHTDNRLHQCETYGKSSTKTEDLQRCQKTDMGEKPYHCKVVTSVLLQEET